jgi:hypothetical protein
MILSWDNKLTVSNKQTNEQTNKEEISHSQILLAIL